MLAHAQIKSDAVGEVEWEVSVDSTIARAHQHAAGAPKIAPTSDPEVSQTAADDAGGRTE